MLNQTLPCSSRNSVRNSRVTDIFWLSPSLAKDKSHINGNSRWHQRTSGEILSFRPDSTGLLQKTEVSALSCQKSCCRCMVEIIHSLELWARSVFFFYRCTVSLSTFVIFLSLKFNVAADCGLCHLDISCEASGYFLWGIWIFLVRHQDISCEASGYFLWGVPLLLDVFQMLCSLRFYRSRLELFFHKLIS